MIRSWRNAATRKVWEGERPNQLRGLDFEAAIDLLEARHEHEDRVRETDHDVSDHHRQDRTRDAERVEQEEQRDPEHDVRNHERAHEQGGNERLAPEPTACERD